MTQQERHRRRFSEDFRKEQVALIEAGKLTIAEVSQLYEVRKNNVRHWLARYGSIKPKQQIIVSSKSDFDRIELLEKENRRLLEMIGKQQVELAYKSAVIEVAKQKLGEDFEKK
ncbi:MAG: transposase [Flavobacteriales bacterium]